jgi:pteridine reductase
MKRSLRGKTALVTGAAKRIGREIALALADAGANVIIHHRNSAAEAALLLNELVQRGVKSWTVESDFEDPQFSQGTFEAALDKAGAVDFLVNSASIFEPGVMDELDFSELMRNVKINTWAPFALSRDFAHYVRSGKIVNLLDTRIVGGDRSHLAYILSKQALFALTEMMALEFAPAITVNGVAPGLILPPAGKDEGYLDALSSTVPLRTHGHAADVAGAVIYLLESEFVTGQVIFVDGGRHLMEYGRGPNHHY